MDPNRRDFLKLAGAVGVAGVTTTKTASADAARMMSNEWMGMLMDLTLCVGCRKCEYACKEAAGFDVPPIASFEDKSVFSDQRRPGNRCFTTINAYDNPQDPVKPFYAKVNCMHCNDPACVSACLVGALTKRSTGAVTYEPWKCMGCRYCMVACPFQIPTYEYENALTPQVRKCTFCFERTSAEGKAPACLTICPPECMIYGKRADLLKLARERIQAKPDVYVDHIYGEHEAGGTSWLYLSGVPFKQVGFLELGSQAPPRLTEAIQHGVFKHFFPPLAWYGLLASIMWLANPNREESIAPSQGATRSQEDESRDVSPGGQMTRTNVAQGNTGAQV